MKEDIIRKIEDAISAKPEHFAGTSDGVPKFRDKLDDAIDAVYKDGAPIDEELVSLMYEIDHAASWLDGARPSDSDFPGIASEFDKAVGDVRHRLAELKAGIAV